MANDMRSSPLRMLKARVPDGTERVGVELQNEDADDHYILVSALLGGVGDIDGLPDAGPLQGDEFVPISQGGEDVKTLAQQIADLAGTANALDPIIVTSGSHAAAANEFVVCNGNSAVTLPADAADHARIGVLEISPTQTVLIELDDPDNQAFNVLGGATLLGLANPNTGYIFEFDEAAQIWYTLSTIGSQGLIALIEIGVDSPNFGATQPLPVTQKCSPGNLPTASAFTPPCTIAPGNGFVPYIFPPLYFAGALAFDHTVGNSMEFTVYNAAGTQKLSMFWPSSATTDVPLPSHPRFNPDMSGDGWVEAEKIGSDLNLSGDGTKIVSTAGGQLYASWIVVLAGEIS